MNTCTLLCIVGYSYMSYINHIDYCKIVDSYHYHNWGSSMCGSVCGCVRQYEYHSTLLYLLPYVSTSITVHYYICYHTSVGVSQYITTFVTIHVWFYDWFNEKKNHFQFPAYLSSPPHLNKFSTVLTAKVIWHDSLLCLKKTSL